jgi:hypothetical protein
MAGLFTNRSISVPRRAASIVLGTLLTLWLVTGSQAHTGLNISRAQYEAALATWNSLNVTDYEATVQQSNWGKWKIVVHIDRSDPRVSASQSHKITHFEALDSAAADLERNVYLADFITVGGLFDTVDYDFYEETHPYGEWYSPGYYVVEFDETMGYPRSITSFSEYATVEIRMENVKILK